MIKKILFLLILAFLYSFWMKGAYEPEDHGYTFESLLLAMKKNDGGLIKKIISSGEVDLNQTFGLRKKTVLMWAAQRGFYDIVIALVDQGASLEMVDLLGRDVLFYVDLVNDWRLAFPLFKELCDRGADSNRRDRKGNLAIWYPLASGKLPGYVSIDLLRVFFAHSGDLVKNSAAIDGLERVVYGYEPARKLLQSAKKFVGAVATDDLARIIELLELEISFAGMAVEGLTLYDYAVSKRSYKVADLLLAAKKRV